jgi:hypothetical protein
MALYIELGHMHQLPLLLLLTTLSKLDPEKAIDQVMIDLPIDNCG